MIGGHTFSGHNAAIEMGGTGTLYHKSHSSTFSLLHPSISTTFLPVYSQGQVVQCEIGG